MSDSMSATQRKVLALIATGSTAREAAAAAGVHRNTVLNWLRLPAFTNAYSQSLRPSPDHAAKENLHNSAQSVAVRSLKIGRNQLCPCGSATQHKRCCLEKPDLHAARRLVQLPFTPHAPKLR